MREKAIQALKEKGYEAVEENAVLMILYDGPARLFQKAFNDAKKIAAASGYLCSIGIRQVQKEGESHSD